MDRQLKLLSDSLKDKKTLISGLNVQNFNKKMELRGFIPVAFDANILAICDTSLDLFNFDVVADKIRVLNPLQKNLYGKTATYTLYPITKKNSSIWKHKYNSSHKQSAITRLFQR